MPLYRTYSEGEFLLGIWKSDETTEQLLASLEHKDWYREKLAVFSEKRKHEWLSVRVLLKALCGEEKEIAYYSSGRPYLKDRSDEESAMMEGDEVYALLLHWSAKEALFKLMGVEEVDFIRHLRIFPFSLSEEGEFEACEYRTGRQGRYRVRYVTHPDFVLTWIIK